MHKINGGSLSYSKILFLLCSIHRGICTTLVNTNISFGTSLNSYSLYFLCRTIQHLITHQLQFFPTDPRSVIFLWSLDFKLLKQWFPTRGYFVSQETVGIVWGHFLSSQLSGGGLWVLKVFGGQRPGVLLKTRQHTGCTPHRII